MLLYYVIWLVLSWQYTSWQGHLGGLDHGPTIGAVLAYTPRQHRELLQWLGMAVLLVVMIGATVVQTSRVLDKESGSASASASHGCHIGASIGVSARVGWDDSHPLGVESLISSARR